MHLNSEYLSKPFEVTSYRPVAYLVLFILLCSVIALLYAPLLMPASYHWLVHTTSESAAQGIEGAWLARLGFSLYGFAVLLLTMACRHQWGRATFLMHASFGVCMIGNAVFSSRPWLDDLPFDLMEDMLHSWMSGLVGTTFALGVLATFFQRKKTDHFSRAVDIMAIVSSIVIPVGMLVWLEIGGLIQRIMFTISYLWYAREAWNIVQGLYDSE